MNEDYISNSKSEQLIKAYNFLRNDVNLSNPQDYVLALFVLHLITHDLMYKCKNGKSTFNFPYVEFVPHEGTAIDFDFISFYNDREDIAEYINIALESIENFDEGRLEGVFTNLDFNIIKDELEYFIGFITSYSHNRRDTRVRVIEDFEIFLSNVASKQYDEVSTPSYLSKLLSELLEAKDGDSIYDPTCGMGSLLANVAKTVNPNTCKFYGQEIFEYFYRMCKINMFVHDIKNITLKCGDTIKNPKILTDNNQLKTFDKIIAIPPFGVMNWGAEISLHDKFNRFEYGIPPKNHSDYAFILHMIKSLKPYGTMCIAVQSGVLLREKTEFNIRRRLIEENLIDTVITLPIIRIQGCNISMSVLIVKKNRTDDNIFFIDASDWYSLSTNREKIITDDHVKDIIEIYKNRENIANISCNVSYDDIKLNNFSLHIKKYIESEKHSINLDIDNINTNVIAMQSQLATVQAEIKIFEADILNFIEKNS